MFLRLLDLFMVSCSTFNLLLLFLYQVLILTSYWMSQALSTTALKGRMMCAKFAPHRQSIINITYDQES